MGAKKTSGIVGTGNFEQYQAMFAKRLSSAASPHQDRRTKRARTRSTSNGRAIRDQLG